MVNGLSLRFVPEIFSECGFSADFQFPRTPFIRRWERDKGENGAFLECGIHRLH